MNAVHLFGEDQYPKNIPEAATSMIYPDIFAAAMCVGIWFGLIYAFVERYDKK